LLFDGRRDAVGRLDDRGGPADAGRRGVSAFAGVDGGTSDQAGLSLGQVNFALALILGPGRSVAEVHEPSGDGGTGVAAAADTLTVSGTNLSVAVNRGLQANQAAIAASSGNTTYRLNLGPDTFGSLEFRRTGVATATTASIGYGDSDAVVAGKVCGGARNAVGNRGGERDGDGRPRERLRDRVRRRAGGDGRRGPVGHDAVDGGGDGVFGAAVAVAHGVSETQTIAIFAPRPAAPTVSTAVSRVTAGKAAAGQLSWIEIAAVSGSTGQYQLSYNGATALGSVRGERRDEQLRVTSARRCKR
jgi:hypothetical protein